MNSFSFYAINSKLHGFSPRAPHLHNFYKGEGSDFPFVSFDIHTQTWHPHQRYSFHWMKSWRWSHLQTTGLAAITVDYFKTQYPCLSPLDFCQESTLLSCSPKEWFPFDFNWKKKVSISALSCSQMAYTVLTQRGRQDVWRRPCRDGKVDFPFSLSSDIEN